MGRFDTETFASERKINVFFLIDYERSTGKLVNLKRYSDGQLKNAEEARLALDLELRQFGTEREVVLLEAADEEALRKTHRRYFDTWQNIAASA